VTPATEETVMGLAYRQRRLLRRIDRALCRSDPEFASRLAMFSRLNAGEIMPAWEQLQVSEAPGWSLMPWPVASAMLGIWAAAGRFTCDGALEEAGYGVGGWPA
jgi:hypothetical protein